MRGDCIPLLDFFAESLACFELHDLFRRNFDLLASSWIAAFSFSLCQDAESSETYQGNFVTACQSAGNSRNKSV
jgi:hypothetical protein